MVTAFKHVALQQCLVLGAAIDAGAQTSLAVLAASISWLNCRPPLSAAEVAAACRMKQKGWSILICNSEHGRRNLQQRRPVGAKAYFVLIFRSLARIAVLLAQVAWLAAPDLHELT